MASEVLKPKEGSRDEPWRLIQILVGLGGVKAEPCVSRGRGGVAREC